MKKFLISSAIATLVSALKTTCLAALALLAANAAQADVTVSNVTAAQRPGTKLVDITYDVASTAASEVSVSLAVTNGAAAVSATSLTGAVGPGVATGTGKAIVWDAGADWNGNVAVLGYTLTADDGVGPPTPEGFALIPAGSFTMGDQSSPLVGGSDELPVHTVQMSAFYMGKYEVTKAEWDDVRAWGITHGYTDLSAGAGKAANHPVQTIAWYDMVKWCNARSEKENLTPCYTVSEAIYKTGQSDAVVCNWSANGYRLPSEAEWEKAARGGLSAQNFPWGTDTISHSQANYNSSASFTYDVSPTRGFHPTYYTGVYPCTSPVGSFAPNGYGLYDMAGNVWELCWDCWGGYPSTLQTDPRGATSGSFRVLRGGCSHSEAYSCRVAFREGCNTFTSGYEIGFRVARSSIAPDGFSMIPAGSFEMGDQSSPLVGDSNELPVHTVNVSAFYMAKYEVTKAMWDEVATWAAANGYDINAAGASGKGTNHPSYYVTWYECVKWCNARSEKENLTPCYTVSEAIYKTGNSDAVVCNWSANGYRLPSEAEWEKAARGGLSAQNFPWGNTIAHSQANYQALPERYSYDVSLTSGYHPTYAVNGFPYTAPVGSFAANGYELYDMAGNVTEWCWDWYSGSYYTSSPGSDPRGAASGSDRVIRGGYWYYDAFSCRVAFRFSGDPGGNSHDGNDMGFRVARSSVPTAAADSATASTDTRDYTLNVDTAYGNPIPPVGSHTYAWHATVTATVEAAVYDGGANHTCTGWTGAGAVPATGTTNGTGAIILTEVASSLAWQWQTTPDTSDGDGDGLTAFDEINIYGTDPTLSDTDGDGLTDAWEVGLGRFSIIAGSFTWSQARADAHARGGELASFPTADRWDRAMETLGANALDPFTGLWIGATDATTEGSWLWVNGETYAFTNWGTGRPSTVTSNTLDYVEVSGGAGAEIGKWYDRSPTTTRDGYILETGYATNPLVADADGDGLNDGAEQAAGSNPFLADTDGDSLSDSQEVNLTQTNPKLSDSNGNGTNDALEDPDADGLNNLAEVTQHGTDPLVDDSDGDGIKDGAEVGYAGSYFKLVQGAFTYPQAAADAAAKRGRVASLPEADDYSRMARKARQTTQGYLWVGLSDAATEDTWLWTDGSTATYSQWLTGEPSGGTTENHVVIMENSTKWADTMDIFTAAGYIFERVGLDPLDPDTDADGLTDGQEITTTHSSPVMDDTDGDGLLDGAEVNTHGSSPLLADTDADGLNDRVEVEIYHSNPTLKDSDGDLFDDLFEVNTGFDPALASSTPDALSTIRTAVEFRFNAATGVSYRIEASTDLTEWNTVETAIIGESAVVTRFYSTENLPRRYFRVRRN